MYLEQHIYASVIGNCTDLCIPGEDGLRGLIFILASIALIDTVLFSLTKRLLDFSIMFLPALSSSNLMLIILGFCVFWLTSILMTVPIS